jgi:hypothetical protein
MPITLTVDDQLSNAAFDSVRFGAGEALRENRFFPAVP